MAYAVKQVGADGKAPKDSKVGDVIRTAGGDYKITGTNKDGSFQSAKVFNDQSGVNAKTNTTPKVTEKANEVRPTQPNMSEDYINRLKNAQVNANINALKSRRDTSLSNLNAEQVKVAPQYQAQRQTVNAQSQQGKLSMAEYMANRGLTNSGASAQAEMNRQGTLNSNLAGLRRAEVDTMADIERRKTDINNAYNTDVASATSGAEVQALQNLLNQYNTDRNFGLQKDQFDFNKGISEAGLTGMYNGQQTMQGKLSNLNIQQLETTLKYLPQQLQDEAKQRANSIAIQGLQLENLPQQYRDEAQARALDLAIKSIQKNYTAQQLQAELDNVRNSIWARTQTTNADVANTYNSMNNRNSQLQLDRDKFEYDKSNVEKTKDYYQNALRNAVSYHGGAEAWGGLTPAQKDSAIFNERVKLGDPTAVPQQTTGNSFLDNIFKGWNQGVQEGSQKQLFRNTIGY